LNGYPLGVTPSRDEEAMKKSTMHATRDAVSESVTQELVRVRPGAEISCKCGNGECAPEKCDEVYAHTKDGVHFLTIHGLGLQGRTMADGACSIYRLPGAAKQTQDARSDDGDSPARLNQKHAAFWAPKDDAETTERPCRTFVERPFWQRVPE
jgi:hypothetical protein